MTTGGLIYIRSKGKGIRLLNALGGGSRQAPWPWPGYSSLLLHGLKAAPGNEPEGWTPGAMHAVPPTT